MNSAELEKQCKELTLQRPGNFIQTSLLWIARILTIIMAYSFIIFAIITLFTNKLSIPFLTLSDQALNSKELIYFLSASLFFFSIPFFAIAWLAKAILRRNKYITAQAALLQKGLTSLKSSETGTRFNPDITKSDIAVPDKASGVKDFIG